VHEDGQILILEWSWKWTANALLANYLIDRQNTKFAVELSVLTIDCEQWKL